MNKITLLAATLLLAIGYNASATSITGHLSLYGRSTLDNTTLENTTEVISWDGVIVSARDGSFSSVPVGSPVAMTSPWAFTSALPTANLWSVGDFSFDLTTSSIGASGTGFLNVKGTGTIKSTSSAFDDTPGTWFFTTQGTGTGGTFSFSAVTEPTVPDGGTTLAFLGLAITGLAIMRRKQ